MDDLERQRERHRVADALSFDTPNCPECLTRMEPTAFDVGEGWVCPSCGNVTSPVDPLG
ncbi:MAG TPA: hypothetical protein VKY71_16460 [Actinotalea caeni]|uniref:hypothetical protein n=1 Tax=Actinotalea caeni TaxID=1348467 RepID=UPI002B4B0931|nr:hypothetical protein [Actinotalea caeni]HLV57153.1 hypothetical protein [Actinotalea caeni]